MAMRQDVSRQRRRATRAPHGAAWRVAPGGPLVVGWTEYVALPDWDVPVVRAKMDTGARSSAIHVEDIERLPRGRVAFDVILDRRKSHRRKRVEAHVRRRSRVRSSNGEYETRLFVSTEMRLGPLVRTVEFSLVDRAKMIHRVLLGRNALEGIYVDVSHRYLLGRPKRRKRRKRSAAKR